MDAEFHLERQRIEPRTQALEKLIPVEVATRRLSDLSLEALQPAAVLLRGGGGTAGKRVTSDNRAALIREYPYMVLALVEEGLKRRVGELQQKISTHRKEIDQLNSLSEPPEPEMAPR